MEYKEFFKKEKINAAVIEGCIHTRSFGQVFRCRRPFFISEKFRLSDTIFGGISFSEKSDLTVRVTSCSANNIPINASMDLVLVKNT